jgi:hypothetical protein
VGNKVKLAKNQNGLEIREASMDVFLGSDITYQSYADRFFHLEKILIFRADSASIRKYSMMPSWARGQSFLNEDYYDTSPS